MNRYIKFIFSIVVALFFIGCSHMQPPTKEQSAYSQYNQGLYLYQKYQKVAALIYFKSACENGHILSCKFAGNMYYLGDGIPQDYFIALEFYTRVCNAGDSDGCASLGTMYRDADGTKADLEKAFTLFEKACNDKSDIGCFSLGALYERGKGVNVDKVKALNLYEQSCNMKFSSGCKAYSRLENILKK